MKTRDRSGVKVHGKSGLAIIVSSNRLLIELARSLELRSAAIQAVSPQRHRPALGRIRPSKLDGCQQESETSAEDPLGRGADPAVQRKVS